jgi:hypothetical protein
MADSPEGPRLSGLARSIDALFSAAPAATPPRAAPTVVTSAVEEDLAPVVESVIEPPATLHDPRPLMPEIFPASQMLTAIPGPPPVQEPIDAPSAGSSVDDSDTLLSFESPWSEPAAEESDATEPALSERWSDEGSATDEPVGAPVSELAAADVVAEPPPPSTSPEPVASDAEGFLAAVDSYVDGDRAQRERIETLAVGLRERLALDPLADAVEKLVRGAGDPPDRTYIALAAAIINPAVASRLVQRIGRERDEAKREEYQSLCRRLGLVMANGLKGALTGALDPAVRRVYHDTLLSMGEVSRPVIEAMVEDENRFLVCDAVVMLGEIGGERAVRLVTSALADTDPRVREKALQALGELGDAEAGRLALGFLDDSNANVRVAAAVTAGKLGLERALRPILQLLEQEEKPDQKVRLLEALGDLGDPGAVPAIEKHALPGRFAKASTDVRVAAYKALHSIGTPHARELVQRAANDKEPAVRAALRGLVRET